MAFRWVYSTEVFDEDRGVTVKMAFRFRDITNQFTLCYADSVVTFEFEVTCDVGLAEHGELERGATAPQLVTLATHVIESSVHAGLKQALGDDALSKVDYDAIKVAILDGVYMIDSDDGKLLRLSPSYKVDFID
jgi:hypothetical protein